jgi:hypothetical protein
MRDKKPPIRTDAKTASTPAATTTSSSRLAQGADGPRAVPPRPHEWLDLASLAALVQMSVAGVPWPGKQDRLSGPHPMFTQSSLMTLEVYCHARGISSGEQAQELAAADPFLRTLFPAAWPTAELLQRFRTEHGGAFQACVRQFLDYSFVARFGERGQETPPVDSCVAVALDRVAGAPSRGLPESSRGSARSTASERGAADAWMGSDLPLVSP